MPEAATRSLPPVPATEWMRPLPAAMRFILQGDARVRAIAAPLWGAAFAEEACRAVAEDARATLWLGPDEYLLLGTLPGGDDASSDTAAADALERALGALPHALVNISHRQFALEVSGPYAAAILSGACPLDLDIGEFPVGMCTRTALAKADIVLWRKREDVFHLEIWRSFSGYVTGLLGEIALEFTGEGSPLRTPSGAENGAS
ncbi:MAG TPA: sarcosine oxidase subunit gamma family protein [Steroidobacteraceae bacterium]|jgi:sarcosine oxidase subunit gamma|nr:sarcosine oxidase subunit gamma family protein [Steroidobacteraceae bacterium]